MLDDAKVSRLGYLVFIGVLLFIIAGLGYQVGIYRGEVKTANTIQSFTEAKNEDLKEQVNEMHQGLIYYQQLLSRAVVMTQDTTVPLKEGTIIIPPQVESETQKS
jgi:hypothetical protein